ncbi:MAG: 16S rRNA (guanine(527)-N(7))-methyltransferase RsmG [Maricaulaceae bacterium]
MEFTQQDFKRETGLDAETIADYARWEALLVKWNARINLVAPLSLPDFWHRHAYDSWQIVPHVPETAENILDMGSGAGFPGLAIAIELKRRRRGHVTLVESAGKKVNFLRAVIRELSLPASVYGSRVENMDEDKVDLITARAFAPLPRLLNYSHPFWGPQTQSLFLKGQGLAGERRSAQKDWEFDETLIPSLTDEGAVILQLSNLKPRQKNMDVM